MKKSLAHIPEHKKRQLTRIVETICALAEVEMIILFGSYARGDYVLADYGVEGDISYEYKSDFDILVVVAEKRILRGLDLEIKIERHISRQAAIPTDVTLLLHDIGYVNQQLEDGQYFFSDIKKEGILLYDAKRNRLARRRKPNPEHYRELLKVDYMKWYRGGNVFLKTFATLLQDRHYSDAAFMLHQVTERYYTAVSLVFTRYKPKTHDIEKLGRRAIMCDNAFHDVFPRQTKEDNRRFKLLKVAYIDARYKPNYKITQQELKYLEKCVKKLKTITRKACQEKIASLG